MEKSWIIAGIVLAIVITGVIIMSDQQAGARFVMQGLSGPFALDTSIPESPATAPMYKVIAKDSISEGSPNRSTIKKSIPSEEEAPPLAEKALEKYGGLPNDAVLYSVIQNTVKKYNTKTETIEEEYPRSTQVLYRQQINGRPVIGAGINVILGENGELLGIHKAWRTVEYDRDVPIISANEAYEKLKKGETLMVYQSSSMGLRVTDIRLGYYAEDILKDQEYYKPVWLFYAAQECQTSFPYPVDAMK